MMSRRLVNRRYANIDIWYNPRSWNWETRALVFGKLVSLLVAVSSFWAKTSLLLSAAAILGIGVLL